MARIGFIGDVYPGEGDPIVVASGVKRRLHEVDYLVANLEGPVTRRTQDAAQKGVHLRTSPDAIGLLGDLGVDAAVLANNHMFDFGPAGYSDTAAALDRAGIAHVGAGEDLAAASAPLVADISGLTAGLLAYSAPEIETVCATDDSPGCAPLEMDLIADSLGPLSREVDVTVLFLHWGLMGYELPTPGQLDLGRRLLRLGPTMVVGCHPHVVQGVTTADRRLIAYSLGDFAFHSLTADGRSVDRHRVRQTGMLLTVDIDSSGVRSHHVLLTRQRGLRVGLEKAQSRLTAVERACSAVAVPRGFERRWRRYVLRRTLRRVLRRLAPWRWRSLGRGAARGLRIALREILGRRR